MRSAEWGNEAVKFSRGAHALVPVWKDRVPIGALAGWSEHWQFHEMV